MQSVVNAALPIFALILAGFLCARRRLFGPGATEVLNNFVVWLALPAVLFQAMAQITWSEIDHPGFLAAFGGGMLVTFILSFALDRRGARLCDRSIEGLDASYSNTGFMGIPLCLVVFGQGALPVAVISTLLTACVLFAGSIVLIEMDLQAEKRLGRTLLKVARSLARNPLILSPLAGLAIAASGIALPGPVLRFTTLLGGAASPCALVTIGLFLAQKQVGGEGVVVARLVALKLILQPALTWLLAFRVFAMPPLWAESAVLLAALPIGTGPFMLAKIYDREAGVTSRAILLSTILSVVTVSLLVARFAG
jgi:malonate transporter and related proteins